MESKSWQVIRPLGEGGVGKVYLARTPEGEEVAVKVLSAVHQDQIGIFEQEVKLLTKLRHPAIAPVLGYRVVSGEIFGKDLGPCFWMEYVEGEDLVAAAQKADPEKIFEWLAQGLEALRFLHAQSILHGDLSPGNVLISKTGQLKLIDFGLASSFLGPARFNAGTLPYLAPERISGKNLPAGDLFSLGTLFYEAIGGSHPRAGCRNLYQLISAQVPPLFEKTSCLEKEYSVQSRVIDRMIRIKLEDRFLRVDDVLQALAEGDPEKILDPAAAEFYPVQMYGTRSDFAKTAEVLKNLPHRSAFFCLHGITGVGKRRFLKELGFECALAGVAVHEVAPRFIKGVVHALAHVPLESLHAFFFRSLESIPPADLAFLLSLKRMGIPEKALFLVFEWNDDGLSEEGRRFFEGLVKSEGAREISLKNLDKNGAISLLEAAVGREVAQEIGDFLFRQTDGNPRLLLEFVKILRERQLASKRHFSKEWVEELGSLHSFEEILLTRLRSLNEEERGLLLYLAAAHTPVGFSKLNFAVGLGDLKSRLDSLMTRGLVIRDEETGNYQLSVPALETTLLQHTPPAQVEAVHQNWFKTIGDEKENLPQKLNHAFFLREKKVIQESARVVAEGFWEKGEALAALKVLDRALETIDDPVEKSQVLRLKINYLNQLGRFEDALKVAEEIFALKAADESLSLKTVKYWFTTGMIHTNLGNQEEAERRLRRCLEEARKTPDPAQTPFEIRSHTLLGIHQMNRGDLTQAKIHFSEALKRVELGKLLKAEILRNLAVVCSKEKNWEGSRKLLEEGRVLYHEEKFYRGELSALMQEGNLALLHDDPHTTQRAYEEAEEIAGENQDEMFLAALWNNLGVLCRRKGDLAPALDHITRALEVFRPLGKINDLAECLAQHAMAEAAVGHFERAEREVKELRGLSEKFSPALDLAKETEEFLVELRDGEPPTLENPLVKADLPPTHWNQELVLRNRVREGKDAAIIEKILKNFYEKLPLSLKVSFEERADYKKWVLKKEENP